jgi:hypothetical protein
VASDDLVRRRARQLAAEAAAAGDPAGWFETLYAEARDGAAVVVTAFAGSPVTFAVADLLALPAAWAGAFDLVAELYTVQALYGQAREAAIGTLPGLVAPGGTLLVIARAADEENPARDPAMMPWPLTRRELGAMAGSQLTAHSIKKFLDGEDPPKLRWRAEFSRG